MRTCRKLLALVVGLLPVSSLVAQSHGPINKAAWLAGCWESRAGNEVVEEMWMAPAGGFMLGGGRTVVGEALRTFEQLRISTVGDTLVYTAIPYRQQEASFKGIPEEGVLTFENLAHDFPQRIIYRRVGTDSLVARVEGPSKNGGTRGFDSAMRRVSCP